MKIDEFEKNFAATPKIAKKLKVDCQAFKKSIDSAISALNKPKEVDDKLKSVSSNLGALASSLKIAKIVRPIRIVAGRLQASVSALKRNVDSAETRAAALDAKVKPIKSALKALSTKLASFIKKLDQLITKSTQGLKKIKIIYKCVKSQPAPLRKLGLKHLNDFAGIANPPVVTLNSKMNNVNSAIALAKKQVALVTSKLNQIQKILKGITSLLKVINPIAAPLKKLLSVLNRKIDLKIFSFSIRQILDGIKLPWPFSYLEKEFWKLANKILNPVLKALKLNIKLPSIPGLNILGQIKLDVFDKLPDFAAMFDDVARLVNNAFEIIKRFNISCKPKASTAKLSELIMRELKGLKPKLVAI